MCCGEVSFEFHRDETLRAAISYHHRSRLRWSAWTTGVPVTDETESFLEELLGPHPVQ
jgi:hypothetical protein